MGRISRYMAFMVMALVAGAYLPVANAVPNIQNFKQPAAGKVLAAATDSPAEVYPVLLVEFADVKFSVKDPKGQFNNLFNGANYNANGAYGSVAEYFHENFRGKRRFAFEVSDVVSLDNPVEVYGAPSGSFNDTDVAQLVKDACAVAVEGGMDFSRYDNDSDGKVDNVLIVFAGYSEPGGGNPNSIWPHQSFLPLRNIIGNGMELASYTCSAELGGQEGNEIAAPGTFCHEFAHYLGLQDLYDTNGEEEGAAPGLYGTLSIMDNGNLLDKGNTPPYFNAVEREILGICEVEDLLPDKIYNLKPVQESDVVYRVKSSNEGEYFLLEYRVAKGWDAHIGGSGLVVCHVDKSNKVYGGISSSDRWKYNNLNSFASHECVRVMSASGAGADVAGVFFPGGGNVRSLVSWEGKMPLRDWGGHSVGIGIKDISFIGDVVSFRTVGDYAYDRSLPGVKDCRALAFQRDIKVGWSCNEDDEGVSEWIVKWKFSEGAQNFVTVRTDSCTFWLSDIKPGGEYEIQVSALRGDLYGPPSVVEATTLPISSMYPYIFVKGKGYRKGDVMDLRVINLVEQHESIKWLADGIPVSGNSICLEKEGDVQITAIIRYNDGSEEKIYKTVEVR